MTRNALGLAINMTSNDELHWSFYRHESGKSQQFQREFLDLVGISSTINNDSTETHYLSLANFGAGYKRLSAKDNDLVIGEVTMQREAVGDDHIGYEVRSINTTSGEDMRLTYVCRNDDYLELHGAWAVQVENSAGDGYRRFACDGTRTTSGAIILDVNGLKLEAGSVEPGVPLTCNWSLFNLIPRFSDRLRESTETIGLSLLEDMEKLRRNVWIGYLEDYELQSEFGVLGMRGFFVYGDGMVPSYWWLNEKNQVAIVSTIFQTFILNP